MLSDPGLIIFDCDGVLVETERLTVDVEARIVTDLGWPMTRDEVVARWVGKSSASQFADLTEHLGHDAAVEFNARLNPELEAAFEAGLTPVDGIPELVKALAQQGRPTCVASSGSHEKMRHTLGLTGLWEAFQGRIYSATEVENGKPAPDLFLHAAAGMGFQPARCAVIEDSVPGVQAGVSARMTVYGYGGGLVEPGQLREAGAHVFDRMSDLLRVF